MLRCGRSTFTSADNSYSEQSGDPRSVVAADKCHIAIRVQASTTAAAAVNDFTQRIFLPSQGKGADYNLVLAVQRSTMA